jgi:hypothetical protein
MSISSIKPLQTLKLKVEPSEIRDGHCGAHGDFMSDQDRRNEI